MPRCRHAQPGCAEISMELQPVAAGHDTACPVRPFAAAGSAPARAGAER
jgi:hypothetical protein